MKRSEAISIINTNPRNAKKVLENIYHGKAFIVISHNSLDVVKKTKRGAEGYIKRQQSVSYYDEMTFKMVTCGSDCEVFEIKESEVIDPISNIKIWYDYILSVFSKDWIVRDVLTLASYYECDQNVIDYVEKAMHEALTECSFTHIDEYETTLNTQSNEEIQPTNNTIQQTEEDNNITLTIELNEELNGIELYFSSKPSQSVIDTLKENKFRWHKKGYWYAKQTKNTIMLAESLQSIYNDIQSENEATKETTHQANENNQSIRVETTSDNKIKVSSIKFVWSESSYIEDNTIVSSFQDAEKLIKNASIKAPSNGCYDKTKFIITWEDNQTYEGRIDITSSHSFKSSPLKEHIESFAKHVIKDDNSFYSEEDKQNYKQFIDTYMLTDEIEEDSNNTQLETPSKQSTNVLDFSSKFKQKQEQREEIKLLDHFTNNILPYIEQDELINLTNAYQSNDDKQIESLWNKLMIATAVRKAKKDILQQ